MRGLPLGSRTTSVDVETSWASGPRASAGASGRRGTFRREVSVPERELHKGTRKHQIVCSSGSWAVAETEWQAVFCNPPCCLFPSLFKARGVPRPSEFRASALLPLQWGQLSASAVRHSGIVLMMLTTLVGRHSGAQRLRGGPLPAAIELNQWNQFVVDSCSSPRPFESLQIIPLLLLGEARLPRRRGDV